MILSEVLGCGTRRAYLSFLLVTMATALPKRRAGLVYGPDVIELTPENFKSKVDDGSCSGCHAGGSGKVFVVDFYAVKSTGVFFFSSLLA